MAKRPRADWSALRELLYGRAEGRCEVSGRPLDFDTFDLHHRRNKGMGGTSRPDTDTPVNLLALDPVVHNGGPASVHADRRGVSGPNGWLVSKLNDRPGDTPVLLRPTPEFEQWFILTADGLRVPISALIRVRLPRPLPVIGRRVIEDTGHVVGEWSDTHAE
jgi:hypothetical protein